jgi:hypothetical protein
MTGRAAGFCAGYPVSGYMNPVGGRAFGGFGGGWGRRNWFYATGLTGWQRAAYGYPYGAGVGPYGTPYTQPYGSTAAKEQELNTLKGEAEYLEDTMDGINKRIAELEAEAKKE